MQHAKTVGPPDPMHPVGIFSFEALEDFFSESFDSHYCAGLRYTVRPGNARLGQAAMQWEQEGKVRIIQRVPAGQAKLGGTGKVGT